jgi:hypothetical protein
LKIKLGRKTGPARKADIFLVYFIGLLVSVIIPAELKYQFFSCPVKFFSFRIQLVYIKKMRQSVDVFGVFGKYLTE